MNKKIKAIIAIVIFAAIIVLLAFIKKVTSRIDQIPDNDPLLAGNTTGNIYNGGYFAESNGLVYFANAYDNYNLYVMTPEQTDIRKLAGGNISFINVAGDYVYYYSSTTGSQAGLGYVASGRGLYRTDIKGKSTFTLARGTTDSMMLIGNHLYYTYFTEETDSNGTEKVTLNRITTSNTDEKLLINDHIKIGGYANGNIYYGGVTGDHHLYSYSTTTDISSTVSDTLNVYLPTVYNGKVYYLDLDDNYALKAMSLSDGSIETIVTERVDTYNLYGNVIFYQNVDVNDYALRRVNLDNGTVDTIASGVYTKICCTSTYTYFEGFGEDVPVYCVPTFGGSGMSTFQPY